MYRIINEVYVKLETILCYEYSFYAVTILIIQKKFVSDLSKVICLEIILTASNTIDYVTNN